MRKLTLEEMKALARERGGSCLSTCYLNIGAQLHWRCADGHEWEAAPRDVKQGCWCPKCGIKSRGIKHRGTLERCQAVAIGRGGDCISTAYVDSATKLRWKCADGHEWEATPAHVLHGSWCPTCGWLKTASLTRGSIEECQALARARGGECLSITYVNRSTKLRWMCADRHEWEADFGAVKLQGSWCPRCAGGLNEERCRCILEKLTGRSWPKTRPSWLVNDLGSRMEIDGFCSEMAIGFEYQGIQHFEEVPHLQRGLHTLARRKADDQRKRDICHAHGLRLIEVPYTIEGEAMVAFLSEALVMVTGEVFAAPQEFALGPLGYDRGKLERLHAMADAKGGACLSMAYLGMPAKHRWRCSEGHMWEATASSIRAGQWCRICSGKAKGTIEEMQVLAQARGWECLSKAYNNAMTNLQWKCAEGHVWEATPSKVKQNQGCPYCRGRRKWAPGLTEPEARLEECREVAQARGGRFLSTSYKGCRSKYRWECTEGHQWEAALNNIKYGGGWCPTCYCASRPPVRTSPRAKGPGAA